MAQHDLNRRQIRLYKTGYSSLDLVARDVVGLKNHSDTAGAESTQVLQISTPGKTDWAQDSVLVPLVMFVCHISCDLSDGKA